ncbi:MAG: four helix bundle protein [Phycisphaerales bacterium]|jgi:four helix bundle protein|nr:four helix bundle protein [Phycisphaeraceae bacterium]
MGRIKGDLLPRVEDFADRVLDVAFALPESAATHRVIDQLAGAGTAVGANVWESDDALSRADFCKCLGIALKELNETRYWLRLIARRDLLKPARLQGVLSDAEELRRVIGSMLARTRSGT